MFYRHSKKVGFNSKIYIYLRALNRRVTWSDLPCRFVGVFFLVFFFFFFLVYHLNLLLGDRIQEWGEEGNRISILSYHYLVGQKWPGPEASSGDAKERMDSGCSWDLELMTTDPFLAPGFMEYNFSTDWDGGRMVSR